MDLLFQPQPAKKEKRIIPRATFMSYHLPKAGSYQYSGFYYIGKNTSYVEKLVHIYKSGYASEGLANVRAELLRSLEQEKNTLPEVIICEARFDFEAIRTFKKFLQQYPALNSIPFVLEGSCCTSEVLELYKTNTKPDDILFIDRCDEKSINIKVRFLCKIKLRYNSTTVVPKIEEHFSKGNLGAGALSKRTFDILVSSITLLLLSPLFLLIALAVKLESAGPIFYISKRAGRGYKIFDFYKFRTMVQGADKRLNELTHLNQYSADSQAAIFFKVNNDPRVTRVGAFLRNTSLDELPQLVNVFLGHMSLVGNRPLPLYEAETLTTDNYAARFLAPAGITGLWQVKKRGNKEMSVEERINIDIAYATKCNFATDLWIIANTPSALLQKESV